jgi:hypothetical protein
MLYQR